MTSIHIKRIETIEEWEAIQPRWRQLAHTNDLYTTPVWYQSWWKAFGQQSTLWLLHMTSPTELYLPMYLEDGILRVTGNIYSHRHGMTTSTDNLYAWEQLLSYFASQRHQWDGIALEHLPENGPDHQALQQLLHNHPHWICKPGPIECWATSDRQFVSASDWEEHLQATTSRSIRKERRRIAKRYDSFLPVTLTCYQTPEEAAQFARIYRLLLARSWKVPESNTFLRNICQTTAEQGWFHSYALHMEDGRPIACQLGFLHNGIYHCYKTAYDQQFSSISPGTYLIDLALSAAVEAGASQVDLLTGDTPYKAHWCNQRVQQYHWYSGKEPEHPLPPPRPAQEEVVNMQCTREQLTVPPEQPPELHDISRYSTTILSVAMGQPKVSWVNRALSSAEWSGIATPTNTDIPDTAWLHITNEKAELHLPTTAVRANRKQRLAFLRHWLCQVWPSHHTTIEINAPIAHKPLLEELGFVVMTQ